MRRAQDAVDAHAEFRGRIMSSATVPEEQGDAMADQVEQEHGLSPAGSSSDPDDESIDNEKSYESNCDNDDEESYGSECDEGDEGDSKYDSDGVDDDD